MLALASITRPGYLSIAACKNHKRPTEMKAKLIEEQPGKTLIRYGPIQLELTLAGNQYILSLYTSDPKRSEIIGGYAAAANSSCGCNR
jgi:hypothetical protein